MLMEFWIILLISEICIISLLIAKYLCCKMGRRKRKMQDVETGPDEYEPEARKRKTRQLEVKKWDAVTYSLKPKGIPNVGASCFMNSMLQCLSWSPCLINQLQHQIQNVKSGKYKGKLATTFYQLLQINHTECDYKAGSKKKKDAENKAHMMKQANVVKKFCKELAKEQEHFDGRTQQDSFEFFNTIISGLEDEALENYPFQANEESASLMEHIMRTCDVTRLFGGIFITSYCYKECGHVEPVFQRFTSLSLPAVVKGKKVTEEKTDQTLATKRSDAQETSSFSVKPKFIQNQRPLQRNIELKNLSGSEDDTIAQRYSSRRSTNSDDEKTPLKKTQYGYGSMASQPIHRSENEAKQDLPSVKLDSMSTSISENNTAVHSSHETLSQLHYTRASLRSSDGNTNDVDRKNIDVPIKLDCDNTEVNTTRSGVLHDGSTESHQTAQNMDNQRSLSAEFPDDARRLFSMRLGRNKRKPKKRSGLELGLDKWSEFEMMMAVDLPCRICGDKKDTPSGVLYKHTKLVSLPSVLVLHINRFKQKGRQLCKVADFISYPKDLDMTSYCSKTLEQLGPDQDNVTQGQKKYSLFGVVNHEGTMTGGHYYTYIKTKQRDFTVIQNLLQNSWKDPEVLAFRIRTQLEYIWQAGRGNGTPTKMKRQRVDKDLVNETKTDLSKEDGLGNQNMYVSKEPFDQKPPGCPTGHDPHSYGGPKESFDQHAPGIQKGHDLQGYSGTKRSFDHQTSDVPRGRADQRDSRDLKGPGNKVTFVDHGNKQDILHEEPPTDIVHQKDQKLLQGNQEDCFIKPGIDHLDCSSSDYLDVDGAFPESNEKTDDYTHKEIQDSGKNMRDTADCKRLSEENMVPSCKKRQKSDHENTYPGQEKEQLDDTDIEKSKNVYNNEDIHDTGVNKGHQDTVSEKNKTGTGRKKGHRSAVSGEDKIAQDGKDTDIAPDGDVDDSGRLESSKESIAIEYHIRKEKDNDMGMVDAREKKYSLDETDRNRHGGKKDGTKRDKKGDAEQKYKIECDIKIREKDAAEQAEEKRDVWKKDDPDETELKGETDDVDESREENNVKKRRKNRSGEKTKDTNLRNQDVIADDKRDDDFSHGNTVFREEDKTSSDDSERRKQEHQDLWYYVSDSLVRIEKEHTVFSSKAAYILMYERI